jgi:tetratricopeptide (TPR) repeat protein
VKVADFGLAKIIEPESGRADLPVSPNIGAAQQHGPTGVMGTPNYMAPEQVDHPADVDHRADIYALGVVFYQMLTGELPGKPIVPPSSRTRGIQIDVRLDEVVLRALEKKPELRYQQVSEVKTMVETIVATPGSSGHESAPSESQSRLTPAATTKKTGWWFCSPLASPEVREIAAHMTADEKHHLTMLVAMFGIWNAATWFAPVIIYCVLPPLHNWKLALLVWLVGIVFYPVWYKMQCEFTCSTEWAKAHGFKPASLRKYSFTRQNILKAVVFFMVFVLAAFGMQKAILHFSGISELLKGNSFYIGQAYFPKGDSIEITSVDRTERRMVVKGHYSLVSQDHAELALYITTSTNIRVPEDSQQRMQITKGRGDFELVHSHLVSGLPHVSMYADGESIAALYFGTKAEALEESKAKWISATNQNPSQLKAVGWWLWQAHELDKAAAKFNQAIELAPGDADAWNGLGWTKFNSGKSQEAEKAFQKAVSLEPGHPAALNGLGQIYLSQGHYDEAEKYLLKAAPQAPAAWFGLARLYLLQGKFAQAEEWAQRVVDSGQGDEIANKMLQAATDKKLTEGLRATLEPKVPAKTPAAVPQASEPADLREARAKLVELRVDYSEQHTEVQKALARIKELERMTLEEPKASAELREAKAHLAELRVEYSEQHLVVQKALARIKELERMTLEEPDASAELRRAKARLAELRLEYAETTTEVQGALAQVKELERISHEEPHSTTTDLKNNTEAAALPAIQAWLGLVDGGQYAESWQQASESFHAMVTQDDWVDKVENVRKPLGKLLSRKVEKAEPNGSYFVAKFDSSFEALKAASETVTFILETNGQWRAVVYLIVPRGITNSAAVEPAQTWLRDIDSGNYAQSWTNAAAYFQSAITAEKLVESLQQVRKPLGPLISRKVKSAQELTSLPGAPDGRYIVMQFETSFANKKSAVETVTFMLEKDGQWRAAGYYIK